MRAEVFQVVEGEQNRSTGGRGSDMIGRLSVVADGISKDELPLLQR
jgi:hypothetical protein